MNTKQIGTICELKVATGLLQKGYIVSLPLGENCPYDLIFDNGSGLYRVQCKNGILRGGSIKAKLESVHYRADEGKVTSKGIDKTQTDYIGIYCSELESVYLVNINDVGSTQCNLRVDEVKSSQIKGIRWANDYKI
jgi:hypothetical protein